ncbi:MAG: hypothetical protein KDC84_01150 [Crocinitomicaceae bacterium]|nr:hypothetical protein [Crocinitomicaceae bacterium]
MFGFLKSHKKSILTILLEIVVVFIGISISFWFDDWKSSREDESARRKYYEGLYSDLNADLYMIDKVIYRFMEFNDRINTMIDQMYQPDSAIISPEEFSMSVSRISIVDNFASQNHTYRDLTSSGKINLISDIELKWDLMIYYGLNERMSKINEEATRHTSDLFLNKVMDQFEAKTLFGFDEFTKYPGYGQFDYNKIKDPNSESFITLENFLIIRKKYIYLKNKNYLKLLSQLKITRDMLAKKYNFLTEDMIIQMVKNENISFEEAYEKSTKNASNFILNEWEFNEIAYSLFEKDPALAIEILEFLVAKEGSANSYDSLGDAYFLIGEKAKAKECFLNAYKENNGFYESKRKYLKIKNEEFLEKIP